MAKQAAKSKPWPRLSETLPAREGRCQCRNCGTTAVAVGYWQEHDEADQPQPIVVALCGRCADELIEPHPRLYRRLEANEPFPGTMDLCDNCLDRRGAACVSPQSKANGGPGLTVIYPRPDPYHVSYRSKAGRRCGHFGMHYRAQAESCDGKRVAIIEENPSTFPKGEHHGG